MLLKAKTRNSKKTKEDQGKGCANLMGGWHFLFFLQGKTLHDHMSGGGNLLPDSCRSRVSCACLVFEVFQDACRSNKENPSAHWNATLSCPFVSRSDLVLISFWMLTMPWFFFFVADKSGVSMFLPTSHKNGVAHMSGGRDYQEVLNPTPLNPTPATCHKQTGKLRCNFRKVALQKLHCNICFSAVQKSFLPKAALQQAKNCSVTSKKLRCRKVALSCRFPESFKPPRLGTHVSDLLKLST